MKKIIYFLLATISISNLSFGQETEFKFTKEGFTDFVVTQCEGKTQAELYKKALDWVSVTYKNPKEVIKAQIENDYIRIEGSSNSLVCLNILGKKFNRLSIFIFTGLTEPALTQLSYHYVSCGSSRRHLYLLMSASVTFSKYSPW